jgi:hypothetical protein
MNPTRRRYLACLCISLTGVSGCSAFERESQPELTIPELWIDNKDDSDHHVEILLLHDDDPVFVKSVAVDAATYEANNLKATGGQAWEDVALTAQTYTLHVRINENDWFTTNFENEDSGCVRVAVEIDRQGTGLFVYFGCE